METKRCPGCNRIKEYSEFNKDTYQKTGLKSHCKKCTNAEQASWRKRDGHREYQKNYHLKRSYGISFQEYSVILERQNGACAICKKAYPEHLCVDHDHKNNSVRGLLCHSCNLGLGKFKDDKELLQSAITYLNEKPATFEHIP